MTNHPDGIVVFAVIAIVVIMIILLLSSAGSPRPQLGFTAPAPIHSDSPFCQSEFTSPEPIHRWTQDAATHRSAVYRPIAETRAYAGAATHRSTLVTSSAYSPPPRLGFNSPAPLYSSFFGEQQGPTTSGVLAGSTANRSQSGQRFVKPAQRYSPPLNHQSRTRLCGFFKCQRCNRRWRSHLVQRKSMVISCSYYRQDCATCGATTSPYAIVPEVCEGCGREQCVCSKETRKKNADPLKQHRDDLCEVCKAGLRHN